MASVFIDPCDCASTCTLIIADLISWLYLIESQKKLDPSKFFLVCMTSLKLIWMITQVLSETIVCFLIGEGGILIHCISGWDRTPLFISLLRLSLWAVSPCSTVMTFCSMIVYCVYHIRMTELIGPSLQLRSSITPWPMTGLFMGMYYCMCTAYSIPNINA